ncbi:hypothetical protein CIL05_12115 [Virgibacillus profundi]|uniref:Uncharacterized protein n=1 Tax=Virgibacillus profundi TaxID=2024555 RepID=A0A2A2IDC6_9BACI|nr:hypothetical protein CIL05_12115 [Virgibacillus profundi]PXY53309.1 hypothetical protein CIT14_12240 [Virgibacillus profundi]
MTVFLFLIPIIGGVVIIGTILIFIYNILRSKKHYYSWVILVMLIIFLYITAHSFLKYINIL